MLVDPNVYMLAENFYRDLVSEVGRAACEGRKEELTQKLAEAMQQAVEQEYAAIVETLTV